MEREQLSKALNSGRCIICFFMGQDESDLLATWVGHGEEEVEREFYKGKRLCNYHLWKLEKFSDDVNMAYITKFLLEKVILTLKDQDAHETGILINDFGDFQNNLSDKNACPICETLSELERKYIEFLIGFIEKQENVELYEKSRGLCVRHFLAAFSSSKADYVRDRLLVIQEDHINALLNELKEFIRKKGPSLRWERTRDEKISYLRAIEKITGMEGIR